MRESSTAGVRRYLEQLLPVAMDVPHDVVCAAFPIDDSAPWAQAAHTFCTDAAVPAIFVGGDSHVSISLAPHGGDERSRLAISKDAPIDFDAPLGPQLRIVSLDGGGALATPYSALHSVVQHVMAPWFDVVSTARDDEDEPHAGVPVARRKFMELELSLQHLQQSVAIPKVHLAVDPAVSAAVEAAGGRADVGAIEPQSLLNDDAFINKLHADMNDWVRAVQAVTRLDHSAAASSTTQEINFWASLERALEDVDAQLQSPQVALTLDVLTHAKRFHATVSFHADTGVRDCIDKVRSYNVLLRDLPVSELLAAPALPATGDAVRALFSHVNKKLRASAYPVRRALDLAEALSRDLNEAVTRLVGATAPMALPFGAFATVIDEADAVLSVWDEEMKEFVYVARDVTRKRGDKFIPIKVNAAHAPLRTRLGYLMRLRKAHEELVAMADIDAWADDAAPLVADLRGAFDAFRGVDVLDVSERGTATLEAAEAAYNARIVDVERRIVDALRAMLARADSARERLHILGQCNRLFVRPRVRAAVQEHQHELLQSVRVDIASLHAKFRAGYASSAAATAAQLRDEPGVSGAVVWAREIERQLHVYLGRVQDVLGDGWEHYADGQRIRAESDAFAQKLDTRSLVNAWCDDMAKNIPKVEGPLLRVERARGAHALRLAVHFDTRAAVFAREAHALTLLGALVPQALSGAALDVRRIYPYALALMHALRAIERADAVLAARPALRPLLVQAQRDVRTLIAHGTTTRWERILDSYGSYYVPPSAEALRDNPQVVLVERLVDAVVRLEERAGALAEIQHEIDTALAALSDGAFDTHAFRVQLRAVQEQVDTLCLNGYQNVDVYVAALDRRIEDVLIARVDAAARGHDGVQSPLHVTVRLHNQVITAEPAPEAVRAHGLSALGALLGDVLALPRIHASDSLVLGGQAVGDYRSLLGRVSPDAIIGAVAAVQEAADAADAHLGRWLGLQCLWDADPAQFSGGLGDDIGAWLRALDAFRATRTFVDGPPSQSCGAAVIDCAPAQQRVSARLDVWQRELLARFAEVTQASMHETHDAMHSGRIELEPLSASSAAAAQVVALVTLVQTLAQRLRGWAGDIERYAMCERTLARFRWRAGGSWLFCEQLNGERAALEQLVAARSRSLRARHDAVRARIAAEDRVVAERTTALVAEWTQKRPVGGDVRVPDALAVLDAFGARTAELAESASLLARAKDALDLGGAPDERAALIAAEASDLQAVWGALAGVSAQLDELRAAPWATLVPRHVRQRLEALVRQTRELPARIRQYAAYEHIADELGTLIKHVPLLAELRTDAFKERHWRAVCQQLGRPRFAMSTLTLGHVWSLGLGANAAAIRQVVANAQGEYTLEVYLAQVREAWTGYALELVSYRNECMLIRGVDALFQLASEHGSGLRAMAASPHYRVFDEEARMWEERIARVHAVFDVWVDVQRQWVYLHGIFGASAEIRHILAAESSRFQSISAEFLALVRRVQKSPFALDVANIPGVLRALERLNELLGKIQKSLGEYLERERMRFPRFYFVGDEDMLEIIGNARDVHAAARHLAKMFGGVAGVELAGDAIVAVCSREGERVGLRAPVPLPPGVQAFEWLGGLERTLADTLAHSVCDAVASLGDARSLVAWMAHYPAQIALLALQIVWTAHVEEALQQGDLSVPAERIDAYLAELGDLASDDAIQRRKAEQLITELTHQRETQALLGTRDSFAWRGQLRYYLDAGSRAVELRMANAKFAYGFEYLGAGERLVQTPLTTAAFLTLTQALHARCGGAPFGPAGTGKTETVKALGAALGRLVLVFNCDSQFDYGAVGRILAGLCCVGAWGCFDEFNRLEERVLSSVSQQIQAIHTGLSGQEIELGGRSLCVHAHTGLFVTMNPTYAGRSHLPDSLKRLFRSVAMAQPDVRLIAQVVLAAQGFAYAAPLAAKMVLLFHLFGEQLSRAPHYDFGLRALKTVLVCAGQLRRAATLPDGDARAEAEAALVVQSICELVPPRLVTADVPLLNELVAGVFPGTAPRAGVPPALLEHVDAVCAARHLEKGAWVDKLLQVYQMQQLAHGLILVGPAAAGKTTVWRVLLEALERLDGVPCVSYVIDPKAQSKEALFGLLDSTTREWTDGLFTHVLRRIVDNVRRESAARHWIVFDGDVDPEWVESLNSVLDDNRMLTLPTGERLVLPDNVRVVFEVDSLRHATLATVSRCGMVWFNDALVARTMRFNHCLDELRAAPSQDDDLGVLLAGDDSTSALIADTLAPYFAPGALVDRMLDAAHKFEHIMEFSDARAIATLFALIRRVARAARQYNARHPDFGLEREQVAKFAERSLMPALVWAFAGDAPLAVRAALGDAIRAAAPAHVDIPPTTADETLIDNDVAAEPDAPWVPWSSRVASVDVDTSAVSAGDVVVPTIDTVRHEELLYSWLLDHRPVLLCGPPGSGKTMVLLAALRRLADLDVVGVNFSSATTPVLLRRLLEQHCVYTRTPSGAVLEPAQPGRWLVIFCDEINLPAPDTYETQRVISFLRQLVEQRGFWRSDKTWVRVERVQFVGACNPPTDPGRVPLSARFLRHAPVVMVDYPSPSSFVQIYTTFMRAVLRASPTLRGYADAATNAMVDVYRESQQHFTPDIQAHYIYSPRELTRWVRGIYQTLCDADVGTLEELVRVWAYEGLRIFQDRLVTTEHKAWTDGLIDRAAQAAFPTVDVEQALRRPILYSDWLSRQYKAVERPPLRDYARARLRGYSEEELDTDIVLHDAVLDLALGADRILRQPAGHLLLLGVSGSGRTTVARFCAWLRGLALFTLPSACSYTEHDFDADLRELLRRVGVRGEKVCWTLDEGHVAHPARLEKLNTLLANAEVAGLFDGDEKNSLVSSLRDAAQREGLVISAEDELLAFFRAQIMANLHVVLTMTPPDDGLAATAAASPALFNRCTMIYCW